jgi:hypothetical protein
LLLLISISARSAGYRLYLEIAVLGIAFAIILIRLNSLFPTVERKSKTFLSTYLFIQILVVCHYLPLSSIPFGLMLTGFASFLINLSFASDPQKNQFAIIRDATYYALPFLISAFFFFR